MSESHAMLRFEMISLIVRLTLFGAVTYYSVRWMINQMDPTNNQKKNAKKRALEHLRRLGITGNEKLSLTEYEMVIAAHLVDPTEINVSWDDIAGLDDVIQELKETVILPIQRKELFADSQLTQPPKDSFLRSRNTNDHEATAMMKAQFMSLWDGLITNPDCTVIVMGATNRPEDLDRAILRRMPATFHIGQPTPTQRREILRLILSNEPTADDVNYNLLAKLTENFSGSDLREMCRNASVYRVRDYVRTGNHNMSPTLTNAQNDAEEEFHDALRPITMDDLTKSLEKMKLSKYHCGIIPPPLSIRHD
ncbi:outer mitochondrial transmembrane helix translocase isoform X4 [Schistocerca gregaria]|uniref:outer mitochondrial transmembrane helix translocase isoform X4 n=1 Tax=Schistocerca gregaria TaxID=7010 RepID=UPI00211EA7F2|nr:outer mitochondrial transmembrane helix translocase isoform X4 [Schistocerca gregaria]